MSEVNFQVKKGLTVPRGTASTPSIIFDAGDTDTGVYSPGANQLAISTNSTGRLFIDSSGNVGLGTSSPNANVELGPVSATQGPTLRLSAGIGGGVGIPEYPFGTLQFYSGDPSGDGAAVKASIAGVANTTSAAPGGELTFSTYPSVTGSLTERMRIDSSGNIGIGTTAPSEALVVRSASNTTIEILNEDDSTAQLAFKNTGSINRQISVANGEMTFSETGSEHMRIDSSGRLLIGTSESFSAPVFPGSWITQHALSLQVAGTGVASSGALLASFSSNNLVGAHLGFCKSSSNTTGSLGTAVADSTTLGTLSFSGDDGSKLVSAAAISAYVDGTPGADDMPGRLTFSTTADGASSPTERMRIDSSGNVGIGTTSPSEALDVSGNVTISGSISKGSGSFKITHPLETKKDTHYLVHSFIEGPRADLIYRGTAKLTNGKAVINLDLESNMTAGTFEALCTNVSCFTSNETDWTPVKGSVSKNKLTIVAQDTTSNATVSWLVIGERKDPHMLEANWTDENGRIIVEPEKEKV